MRLENVEMMWVDAPKRRADQSEVARRLSQYILQPLQREAEQRILQLDGHYLLTGTAGAGKTVTARRIIDRCVDAGIPVVMCATTHCAAGNLSPEAVTVHKAFGLYLRPDPKGPGHILWPKNEDCLTKGALVVLDEASMCDPEIIGWIMSKADDYDLTIVFIADPCQLPPVGFTKSPVTELDFTTHIHLPTSLRQDAGSALYSFINSVRDCVDMPQARYPWSAQYHPDIWVYPPDEWLRQYKDACSRSDYTPAFARALTYTNAAAALINDAVRAHLYQRDAKNVPFIPGERVVANESVWLPGEEGDEIVIPNNCSCIVRQCTPYQVQFLEIRDDKAAIVHNGVLGGHLVYVDPLAEDAHSVQVFVPNSGEKARYLRYIKQKMKRDGDYGWDMYYHSQFSKMADLRPQYAQTVHKAQGQTIEHVFIDVADMVRSLDAGIFDRMIYTAASRASKSLCLNCEIPSAYQAARGMA